MTLRGTIIAQAVALRLKKLSSQNGFLMHLRKRVLQKSIEYF